MGLFWKKSITEETKTKQNEIQSLLQNDFKEGEFTLKIYLWGHLSRYKYNKERDTIDIIGDKYFKNEQINQLINDFVDIFGIDSLGDGKWPNEVDESNMEDGRASRTWYLDDNFDCKPINAVMEFLKTQPEGSGGYKNMIIINADKNEDDDSLQLTILGWTNIKDFLKTKA